MPNSSDRNNHDGKLQIKDARSFSQRSRIKFRFNEKHVESNLCFLLTVSLSLQDILLAPIQNSTTGSEKNGFRYMMRPNMERGRFFCLAMTLVVLIKMVSVPSSSFPSTHLRRGYDESRCLEENLTTSSPCNSPRRLEVYPLQSVVDNSFPTLELASDTSLHAQRFLGHNESISSLESEEIVTDRVLPAVILSVATIIILCSVGQYAADFRARCRQRWNNPQEDRKKQSEEIGDIFTCKKEDSHCSNTSGITHSNGSKSEQQDIIRSEVAVRELVVSESQQRFLQVERMLPPLPADVSDSESSDELSPHQTSISRVSTLTNSVAEPGMSFGECMYEKSGNYGMVSIWGAGIKELSDEHRVSLDRDVSKLVATTDIPSSTLAKYQELSNNAECANIYSSSTKSRSASVVTLEDEAPGSITEVLHSTCSSLSDTSLLASKETENASLLHGEACLVEDDATPKKMSSVTSLSLLSLEFSPDGPEDDFFCSVGRRDIAIVGRLLFDEDSSNDCLGASFTYHCKSDEWHPNTVYPQTPDTAEDIDSIPDMDDYVREIYFVPVSHHISNAESAKTETNDTPVTIALNVLGLRLSGASCGATHPSISEVMDSSPLAGRIFVGDYILKVNGVPTTGLSSDEVETFLANSTNKIDKNGEACDLIYQMIKLTIMSSHPDDASSIDIEENITSEDTGLPDTAVEF